MTTHEFWCEQCDHHVRVELMGPVDYIPVEAWCCTAHLRPLRMTTTDPHAAHVDHELDHNFGRNQVCRDCGRLWEHVLTANLPCKESRAPQP